MAEEVLNFVAVLVTAVCIAGIISSLYAMGLRLWAGSSVDVEGEGEVSGSGGPNMLMRTGAAICFAACVAIVLFALWLMIPMFH